MNFSQELVNRIVSHLAPLSFQELMEYSAVNRSWYLATRQEFYNNLRITDNIRKSPLLISRKQNSFGLLTSYVNVFYIAIRGVDPFHILNSITTTSLPRLQQIRVDWGTLNQANAVKKNFYAANFAHQHTINVIDLPPNDRRNFISFRFNGANHIYTIDNYVRLFRITSYTRYGELFPVNIL